MLKLRTLFALLISLTMIFAACDETTSPEEPKPKPDAPSNMRATSIDHQTISLRWDLSASESNTLFRRYVLTIEPGVFAPIYFDKGVNNAEVDNLTEGTVYTFTLKAEYTNGEVSTSSATVQWSPATRFTLNAFDNDIKVYEAASSFGSGLDLFDKDNGGPATWTVGAAAKWNLALDTRSSALILASPKLVDYNYTGVPPTVHIAETVIESEDLNQVYDSQALNAKNFAERSINLKNYNKSIVLIVRLIEPGETEFTYAKVLVKYVSGGFLQGTTPNRFVQFYISYQKTPGVPYAKVGQNGNSQD